MKHWLSMELRFYKLMMEIYEDDTCVRKDIRMNEQQLQTIIKKVITEMSSDNTKLTSPSDHLPVVGLGKGVFEDMNDAISAAKEAQRKLQMMPNEFREQIIAKIREKINTHAGTLAKMGVAETGMGRESHKVLKHQLVANKTPGTEAITPHVYTGDQGLTLIERGPWGVIGAITPSTNPSETVFCNTIGMIAAGNAVVFNPHPGAKNVSNYAVQLINEAALECGAFENLAVSVLSPTLDTGDTMFKHDQVPLLVCTGGPGVVKAVLSSGKPGFGAGAGNPPVFVDETADIPKAARDIINGATFDNNLPCIAEKEIVVMRPVADQLIREMLDNNDCYWLDEDMTRKLVKEVLIKRDNGQYALNRKWVGRDADKILKAIGINAPESIRCILFEGCKNHLLIKEELMMPILGVVKVDSIDEGIETCLELEGGNRHSAHMHSKNIENLTKFARAIDTAIFVKNAPSYAGIGFGGEGYTTFTIASKTGQGLTNANSFTKERRCVMSDFLYIR